MSINDATPAEWDAVTKPAKYNEVTKPVHYNNGGVECIEYIAQQTEDLKSYLEGNAIKYLHRYKYKGRPLQDLSKAVWYIQRLAKEIANEGN